MMMMTADIESTLLLPAHQMRAPRRGKKPGLPLSP